MTWCVSLIHHFPPTAGGIAITGQALRLWPYICCPKNLAHVRAVGAGTIQADAASIDISNVTFKSEGIHLFP